VAEPHSEACGHCYLCRSEQMHICPMKRAPGWGVDGAFAKYVKMAEKLLHHIPDDLPLAAGSTTAAVSHSQRQGDHLRRQDLKDRDHTLRHSGNPRLRPHRRSV
jgi:threonine dehydrogenase-like Zn-dependent dehydrogenase